MNNLNLEKAYPEEFVAKIKLLEDNAFSDRAKRIELENKVEALENTLDQYKKQIFEELKVGLMPVKYYIDEVKRLEKAVLKIDKEVFPEDL